MIDGGVGGMGATGVGIGVIVSPEWIFGDGGGWRNWFDEVRPGDEVEDDVEEAR